MSEKQEHLQRIRIPVRGAIENFGKSVRDLIGQGRCLIPDEYAKKLLTEINTLNRLKNQLSTLDNEWIAAVD